MENKSIRQAVLDVLRAQTVPVSRAYVVASLPNRHPNSVYRMLRDLMQRGTVVETRSGLTLRSLPIAAGSEEGTS